MDRSKALAIIEATLPEHRYKHTVGVMETAISLAKRYGANEKKAEIAAIFHDYAKFRPKDEMRKMVLDYRLPNELLEFGDELLHAPCGAILVREKIGITDQEIFDAIYYHTTGRPEMTLLEKVIYLADYIEPGRQFKGVEEVRALAIEDINEAIIQSLVNTMQFLMNKKQAIFPETLATYNTLVKTKSKEKGGS